MLCTATRKFPVNSNGKMERLICNFHYMGYYCSPNLSIHQNSTQEPTWNFLVTLVLCWPKGLRKYQTPTFSDQMNVHWFEDWQIKIRGMCISVVYVSTSKQHLDIYFRLISQSVLPFLCLLSMRVRSVLVWPVKCECWTHYILSWVKFRCPTPQ